VSFLGEDALQVYVSDITREFEVETELFETLSMLISIFESIEEAIIILDDPDLTLQSANIATEKTFKMDRSAYKGKTLWHLIPNEADVEMLISDIWTKLPRDGILRYNFDMQRDDGVAFPAMHTITEVLSSSGKKIALMWIVTNMTQREYLNQALEEVEARYRILFERAGDVIFIIDVESFQIVDVNEVAEQHIGYSRSELIGKTIHDITPKDRHESLEMDINQLKQSITSPFQGLNLTK
jgi:PAS domain S-box-containing protein